MKKTKRYTREEKIAYYERQLKRAQERLEHLKSDDYQDWSGRVSEEIAEKRSKEHETAIFIIAEALGKALSNK